MEILFHHHFPAKQVFELPAGSRPFHILMLLCGGSFRCSMNDHTFEAGPGEIVCFPANVCFERSILKPLAFYQFGFVLPGEDPCAALLPAGKLPLPQETVRRIIALLDWASLSSLYDSGDLYAHVISHILMENMMAGRRYSPDDAEIARAVRFMNERLHEPIRMEALAEQLHLSYTGFLLKFRRVMKCTPAQYLIRLRMQRARQLLTEGNLKIGEIAGLCGYSNAYYFANAFHRAYGMPPSALRKRACADPAGA